MSLSSYDELLKQVECLKSENSHLRQELQDNSSHLTKLENEASNMKDVLSHIQLAMQDGECEYQEGELFCEGGDSVNSHLEDLSTDDLSDQVQNESWAEGVDNVTCLKSAATSPNGKLTDVEHEIYAQLHNLDLERNALMREIQTEDSLRERFYQQLEILSKRLENLPLTDTYNLQTDMTRRQVEYEAKKLEEAMTEKFGTSELITQRQEARLKRIRNIEAEMMILQQRHQEQQLLKQQKNMAMNQCSRQSVGTNTALCGEIFVPKPGYDNARTSDRTVQHLPGGIVRISVGAQTSDVIIQENPDILQANMLQNNNLSSIYHGSWPIGKELTNHENGGIPDANGQDLASVMSFNTTSTSMSSGSNTPNSDLTRSEQNSQQQLGTKVEMVYSLLSMLGTHDKDDMSRTLLAMSSSQDSCIAMRQSGCLPLLIQLLHGSDKDSGLLGNTRGSKSARARASAALHNIVHSHPDDKRGRREARVLRLLEQIRAHCDQLRGDNSDEEEEPKNNKLTNGASRPSDIDHHPGPAIAALMKLSFDEEHRHAICTLGGLQGIAELLEVDHNTNGPTTEQYNITMRRYACMALTNLTFGDGTNKALLCSMKGPMRGLVAQLTSPNEDLCQVAASVLRNLSWRADLASKKTLREVSAVTTLMNAAMQVKKESTLKSILSALWNLSAHCTENKADICAVPGALEFLVSTLTYKSPSKTLAIIENGGGILRNVSSHVAVREDYRTVLRQHGCLQLLLKHLRSTSLTIVSNACGTLWNLSARCQEDQQTLWEMGAVSMLRNLVHSKHKMISMGSAAALKNLLSARPAMKNLDLDRLPGCNRPGLHARKVRALEQELDQNLAETCDNVESPRNSPTEKKDNAYTRRFSGDNIVVFPVGETEPRRSLIRNHVFSRSGSSDSAENGKLRSPQRVARSGSQDSVGSTHSDISHDRSRVHSMLAKSSRLLHERQGSSLERKRDGSLTRFSNDTCQVDRTRIGNGANNRILQVMQEVAMHAGLPVSSESDSDTAPRNVRAMAYQAAPIKGGNYSSPQRNLIDQFGKKPFNFVPNAKDMYMGPKRNNVDINDSGTDGDEQPINYSLKYQDVGDSTPGDLQLNNRPAVKVGNFVGSNVPRPMPNIVHNQFPVPRGQGNMYEPRHRNIGSHQGIPSQFGCYAETDIDADEQPTNFSLRYAENVEENFQDQPINYSMRYQETDVASQYKQRYAGPDPASYKHMYSKTDPTQREDSRVNQFPKQNGNPYQESETESSEPYDHTDPNCPDCKLEEARRTNDRLDEYMPSFFLDDQVKTFCTEGTPYLSTATSLTDLTGKGHYKDDDGKKDSDDTEDESKSVDNGKYEEETSGSGSRSTDLGTGSTVKPNPENQLNNDDVLDEESTSPPAERSFHATTGLEGPLDQPKTYCEEGTPVCFSRVSSLSSLHSSEARDVPEHHGRHQLVLSSIEESDKGENMSASVIENCDARKPRKDASGNPGAPEVVEKEHKTVTFDDHHHVEETPLMFSRCSSLGSLSSFDVQSVHSSVVSEYSRRASEVVSPSELPDSPSETMPTSPKPESEDKPEEEENQDDHENETPTKFTKSIVSVSDIVKPVQNLAAIIDTDSLSDISKTEAPVVYAEEGTPPLLSETQSLLSALTLDEEAGKSQANDSISDQTKISQQLNEENSSMSEVSEGEEDILAQCISSAMPVPTNSNRKMRKSSSDNALKKKSAVPKPEPTATKSKLPMKVHSNTLDSSKSRLPLKDKSPLNKKAPEAVKSPVKNIAPVQGTPKGSRIAQNVNKSPPANIVQGVPKSPQTPRAEQNFKPQTPRVPQTPKNSQIPRTPPTARSVYPAQGGHMFSPSKQMPNASTPRNSNQHLGNVNQSAIRQPYTSQPVDDFSYSPDFNQDTVRTYATEGTPLNFSNANSVSDLSALSFDDTSVHFKDSPSGPQANDDVRSDNSSICEESEELVSQVIQAAMPKSKVARRLDMDRQAEGAEDLRRKPTVQVQPNVKVSPSSFTPASFQPQRTSSQSNPPQPQALLKNCEAADTVKTFAVEGTPLNFSNATSLSDLTVDSTEDTSRMRDVSGPKFSNMQSAGFTASYAHEEESVFYAGDSVDSPKVYQVEDTPLTFSRNDSLSSLSMFSCDVPGGQEKHVEASDNVSSSSSSIPKERHVVGQSSEESSVIDQTNKDGEDNCNKFAIEDTPVCFSRNSSLSSLHSPEPEPSQLDCHPVVSDQHVPFKVEDTPTVFSRNSSLSELSVESSAFEPTPSEQALLDECISSAMPKSRVSRDERSRRSTTGRSRIDKYGKKLSKSASLELNSEMSNSADDAVFKKPCPKTMSYSCSDAVDSRTYRYMDPSRSGNNSQWKRSHSQDSENFLKDQKNSSNSEIAKQYRGSVDALEKMQLSYDNRMLEEARALRQRLLMASVDSAITDSVTEKMDSEKSHLGDSFLDSMALGRSQTSQPSESVHQDLTDLNESAAANEADTTVTSSDSANETVLCNNENSSLEEEISAEDVLLLEQNASLIVSELNTNQMTESACDDDMFIENETLSLVSNDYTSDTASEISFSWSNTSEKVSEYSGSTISQTDGSVCSSQKGPKILKPGKNNALPLNKTDQGAVRGRRKPLYSNKSSSSSAKSVSTVKSDLSARSIRPVTNQKSAPAKSQSPGGRKPPPKPPNQPPAPANKPGPRRVSNSPVASNRSNSASSIPRSPMSKTSPPSKTQPQKEAAAKTKTERPKPPVKQATFIKETSSVNAPKIDGDSQQVKLREKKSSPSSSQRNSGGSERNSGGNAPEAWSKALDGFNFIVDTSQENGYGQPYKQIQMQRNAKEAPGALKRNTSSSPAGRKSNLARPVQGPPTPPRSNSKSNLTKTGSGSNLKKTSSGTSLTKTQSGSNLSKTSSGTSLNKGNSASNLKKPESKTDLKKSDSNASLKNTSRPSTPVGRKNSNSSLSGRKNDSTPNKSVNLSGDKKAATPTSDKKPPIGGKKPAASKIATLWKKEDGESPPASSVSRLPVAASKPKQAAKPSGLPTPTKAKPNKPAPPKRSDSLSRTEARKESMPKSSTYDKITADLDASHVPSNDSSPPSDAEEAADLDTAFTASPSITLSGDELDKQDAIGQAGNTEPLASFYLDRSELKLGTDSDLTCSVDSLDDISMHSLPVNSGTWKKKHVEGSLALPNADETCRSVPSSLSTIVNQSCDDSDLNTSSTVWRKYPEANGLSGEPQIWVKRDSKKDKSKSKSKKESKSVAQSIKSTLFGKKPTFGKIFGSQKQSNKDKKNKEEIKTADNCRNNLLANPKAGTLWQESRTSPSAIVPPFNYSPPANTQPRQEAVVAPTTRTEPVPPVSIGDTSFEGTLDNKRTGTTTPALKHATKTEMLLARRRQSYLNNSMKIEDSGVEDESKRPCMVTTV